MAWRREAEVLEGLIRWWRKPPLRERVLAVLADAREPLLGRQIAKRADAGFVGPYTLLHRLEAEGLVASREAPEHAVVTEVRVYCMRVYWLTQQGRRHRAEHPELAVLGGRLA